MYTTIIITIIINVRGILWAITDTYYYYFSIPNSSTSNQKEPIIFSIAINFIIYSNFSNCCFLSA